MCQHAAVHWQPRDGTEVRREDVVCRPRALQDGTADSMLCALRLEQPRLPEALAIGENACLAFTLDAAKANVRLTSHVLETFLSNEDVVGLAMPCLHHGDSLCLKNVTNLLNIACPMFCAVKQFQRGGCTKPRCQIN